MGTSKSDNTRQLARSLYIHENRTQQEIADAVGVSRQTVIRWAQADKWEEFKTSITLTREEQIKNLHRQIAEINRIIAERGAEDGPRHATTKEADIINKLSGAIEKLEKEVSVQDIVSVGNKFIGWLRPIDLEQTKTFVGLFDKFIKSML